MQAEHPFWDTNLTKEEKRKLSPSDHRRRNDTSVSRKIAIALADLRSPEPPTGFVPRDRKQLRRWTNPVLGLWPWEDREVDHPNGRNAPLVAEWEAALRAAKARLPARLPSLKERLRTAEEQARIVDRQAIDAMRQLNELRRQSNRPRKEQP